MRPSPLRRRLALATMEVVLTTAVILPMAVFLFVAARQLVRYLHTVIGNGVGWPFL
jgi:hypothetical protein